MPNIRSPRKGSLQFWPRKRAKKVVPRIRTFVLSDGLSVFPGYKVGMTHAQLIDKKEVKSEAITVVECPPVKVVGIRIYKNKKVVATFKKGDENFQKGYDEIRVIMQLQPKLIGLGKKGRIFEVLVSGNNPLEYAKGLIGKEVKVKDVFKDGQDLDVHAITKGKGVQGTVKRFGVAIRQHKAEKTKRGIGTLGPWQPKRVSWRVAQAGKMGYHLRTEYNKNCLKISNNPKEINVKGGFLHYGLVKNDYVLLKGSIPGSVKRLVLLSKPMRGLKERSYFIKSINLDSKQ